MSSDEEDYMSEAFLAKCVPEKNDIKPGLIHARSAKRQHEIHKRQTEDRSKRSKASQEVERRNEGLQQPIGSDNKGFSLMQKMGYKPGEGIGKTSGRVEPIGITVKTDRFGLGRETLMKEIAELKLEKMLARLKRSRDECSVEDYRRRIFEKKQERVVERDLRQSQRACERLDRLKNIEAPDQPWFWPETKDDDEKDVDEEESEKDQGDSLEPHEKLIFLTQYLRQCHLYCIWCGTQFEDESDLAKNCPGPTKDDH